MTNEALIVQAAQTLPEQARAFTVTSADDAVRVAAFLHGVKALRAEIAATFDEHIARAYTAHKALVGEKRAAEAAAIEAETIAKTLLRQWDDAEARRVAAERQIDERERAAEIARLDDIAAHADAAGDYARADELRVQARAVPVASFVAPKTTPDGVAVRMLWSAEVVDFAQLVCAVAARPEWLNLLKPDPAALNALARSLRVRFNVPGVRAVCSKEVAASRRRS